MENKLRPGISKILFYLFP